MPRYYFNLIDHLGRSTDDAGIPLSGLHEVPAAAIRGAKELIAERLRRDEPIHPETILEITNAAGTVLHSLAFCDILSEALEDCPEARRSNGGHATHSLRRRH